MLFNLDLPIQTVIPKIIHQTYRSHQLPDDIASIVNELKQRNPDFEYRFYDDEAIKQYIKTYYGLAYLHDYLTINPIYGAARADFFRYLLMYREGGVYLDIKSSCTVPLKDLIKDKTYIFAQWPNEVNQAFYQAGKRKEIQFSPNGELQQWHIITAAGSPFLKAVIEQMIKNIRQYNAWRFGVSKRGVLRLTGPIMYTQVIYPMLSQYSHSLYRYHTDIGLIYSNLANNNHKSLLNQHYSFQYQPIIQLNGLKGFKNQLFAILFYIYKHYLRY